MPESAKDEFVRLTSAGSLQEAALWKAALQQEGVRCEFVLSRPAKELQLTVICQ